MHKKMTSVGYSALCGRALLTHNHVQQALAREFDGRFRFRQKAERQPVPVYAYENTSRPDRNAVAASVR
jgi:hypothetical protein